MAEKKEKQYVSDNAQLMAEWDWEKNNELGFDPRKLTCGSGMKVWWQCSIGHEWQVRIADRTRGDRCPFCLGRRAIKGINDLQTVNPIIAKEWNYDKNEGLTPADVTSNSGKKVWWICEKGHEWRIRISNRNKGSGCPYCSGRNVIRGINDLQTVNPILAKEWNYEKNCGLSPMEVLPNSNKKVWWQCIKGHEWPATIYSRTKNSGCPFCAGQRVIKGYNDLETINPNLAKEWNYDKNKGLNPSDVMPNSNEKVWWKCSKGHEWQASIYHRNRGNGCSACSSERRTSFPEYAIIYYLKQYGVSAIHSYKGKGYELDVYIPSKSIAIEYDGYYWHKNKSKKDLEKNSKCAKDGIKLYRIREELLPLKDSSIDYVVQKNQKNLPEILKKIIGEIVEVAVDIKLERDSIAIENLREYMEKESSILHINPKIAKEWNYEKNGTLKPENFTANSGRKVWWICKKGHEWPSSIYHRNNGRGCPYCSGKKVLKDFNDLLTVNPTLCTEWNYEKNGNIKPDNVTANSGKRFGGYAEKDTNGMQP